MGRPAAPRPVFATGGGSRSDVWTQLRADVTGRELRRPAHPGSAFGSAVLAASHLLGDLSRAGAALVTVEARFEPDPARADRCDAYHGRLVDELVRRGVLPPAGPPS